MKYLPLSYSVFSRVGKYRMRMILYIAVFWTVTDIVVLILFRNTAANRSFRSYLLMEVTVFVMSCLMGYLFVYTLKNVFRKRSFFINFIFKSIILLVAAFLMHFFSHFVDSVFISGKQSPEATRLAVQEILQPTLLIRKTLYWLILFVVTELFIVINEKYSPGVFLDLIRGKYMQPKIEKRIIMFMDLIDSTPIAEKLGHAENFKFIRDFVFHVSMAIIENDGRIYQYVGDEIVVSWLFNKKNMVKSMAAIIEARKNLQSNGNVFRNNYGLIPEFRVGLHMGDVTVGEIGIIKKDLAMSGDTMNTTARIRSACNELNQKFIMSKDFMDNSDLKEWQGESLGIVDLKGKAAGIELFSIRI